MDIFDVAVARTVLEHPLLQVALVDEDSNRPGWAELGGIDLAHHIQWRVVTGTEEYDAVLEGTLQGQLDSRFPDIGKSPGWRVNVVRPEHEAVLDVIFTWHHSYSDGMGAKLFHEGLLGNLNSVATNKKSLPLEKRILKLGGVADKFTPPQQSLGKYTITLPYAVSNAWRELLPPILVPDSPTAAFWAPIPSRPTKTQIRGFTVGHLVLQKVLATCHANGTTLTGLFHGLVLVSLAGQLSEDRAAGFAASTARDMRPCTPAEQPLCPWVDPKQTIVMNISLILHEFGVKEVARVREGIRAASETVDGMDALAETVWSVAKDTREKIQRDVETGLRNTPVGLAHLESDWRAHFKTALKKPRTHSWIVTNLGVMEGVGDGTGWVIRKARFSLSAWATGPAVQICVVTVKGGDLAVDVTWQDGVVDAEVGEQVAADLEAWLGHFGR